MDTLEVRSTSKHSAICDDIIVRQTAQIRLLFRPEIVDNPHDAAATLRGTFIYQRKGKHDSWVDTTEESLGRLKKGEGYKLELKSGELLPLLRKLSDIYKVSRRDGVPRGKQRYVKLEENLAEFLALSQDDLNDFLSAHRGDAISTLHKVLHWLANSTALADFIGSKGDEISVLNAMLGVAGLRTVLDLWRTHQTNPNEDFWQDLLGRHAFVLSQVFAFPILKIGEKAYVGGKRLDNNHGNLADFLATIEATGSVLIIEIKTPTTRLLGAEYRDEVYPPSTEFAGAISQVLKYRETLSGELARLREGSPVPLLGADPRCLVVAGHSGNELVTDGHKRSFERFRDRLSGVTAITFDELFRRVASLEALLTAPNSESS